MNTKPLLKDLCQHVTPCYAANWIVIGTLLGIPQPKLEVIELDNPHKAAHCCNAMLKQWLEMDTSASWKKLFATIESPAVTCSESDKGNCTCMLIDIK